MSPVTMARYTVAWRAYNEQFARYSRNHKQFAIPAILNPEPSCKHLIAKRHAMKIGVIGAGKMGANAARLFAKAGNQVAISNSRGPESLRELVSEIGPNAQALTVNETAAFADLV